MPFPTPIEDYLIILQDEVQEEKSNLFIPDQLKDKPKSGLIKSVGKGKYSTETGILIPMEVKEGQRVLFKRYGTNVAPVPIDGVEYLCMRQSDIILIL